MSEYNHPPGGAHNEVEVDQLLRRAMHCRPEPIATPDLARLAMALARKKAVGDD